MPNNDYILRSDALKAVCETCSEHGEEGESCASHCGDYALIQNIPAADVEPVRHGRWIPGEVVYSKYDGGRLIARYYDQWTCSVCNYVINDQHYSRISYKRCPECGAKMDKEVVDE